MLFLVGSLEFPTRNWTDPIPQPFQIVDKMKWLTIPSCTLMAGLFFGFLVAGEEIESKPLDPGFLDSLA